jgi:hypothetical protein
MTSRNKCEGTVWARWGTTDVLQACECELGGGTCPRKRCRVCNDIGAWCAMDSSYEMPCEWCPAGQTVLFKVPWAPEPISGVEYKRAIEALTVSYDRNLRRECKRVP